MNTSEWLDYFKVLPDCKERNYIEKLDEAKKLITEELKTAEAITLLDDIAVDLLLNAPHAKMKRIKREVVK